jgi:hypothetical protein
MEELSKAEIKFVLTSFKNRKILGLNGWPIEFFIGFHNLLEEDLLRVVKEVRSTKKF